MPLNFPASPANGATYTYLSTVWQYSSSSSSWVITETAGNFSSLSIGITGTINIGTDGSIVPSANATISLGTTTNQFAEVYGTAYRARYADLAEKYHADAAYEAGTVLVFGGENEVTVSTMYSQTAIAGVVSDQPAICMNSGAGDDSTHPYVALQGRVPVKVTGIVNKGDILVASDIKGVAIAWKTKTTDPRMTAYIGIAITEKSETGIGTVEVKVGK